MLGFCMKKTVIFLHLFGFSLFIKLNCVFFTNMYVDTCSQYRLKWLISLFNFKVMFTKESLIALPFTNVDYNLISYTFIYVCVYLSVTIEIFYNLRKI